MQRGGWNMSYVFLHKQIKKPLAENCRCNLGPDRCSMMMILREVCVHRESKKRTQVEAIQSSVSRGARTKNYEKHSYQVTRQFYPWRSFRRCRCCRRSNRRSRRISRKSHLSAYPSRRCPPTYVCWDPTSFSPRYFPWSDALSIQFSAGGREVPPWRSPNETGTAKSLT